MKNKENGTIFSEYAYAGKNRTAAFFCWHGLRRLSGLVRKPLDEAGRLRRRHRLRQRYLFYPFQRPSGLYPYPAEKISRREYVSFTDVMKPYLRPRWGGIDRLETYIEGFGRFLSDRGESALRMKPWPGESGLPETKAILKKQLQTGWLIPCLTLRHSHPAMRDYDWHWYILNGYEEQGETLLVKAVTFGAWRWLDFAVLWNTGHDQKGGLILYDLPEDGNTHRQ